VWGAGHADCSLAIARTRMWIWWMIAFDHSRQEVEGQGRADTKSCLRVGCHRFRIELVPLLRNGSECQPAYDASTAELCQQANGSQAASDLRRMLTGS
jgi:hypothetical protein